MRTNGLISSIFFAGAIGLIASCGEKTEQELPQSPSETAVEVSRPNPNPQIVVNEIPELKEKINQDICDFISKSQKNYAHFLNQSAWMSSVKEKQQQYKIEDISFVQNLIKKYQNGDNTSIVQSTKNLKSNEKARLISAYVHWYYEHLDPNNEKMEEIFMHFLEVANLILPEVEVASYFHMKVEKIFTAKSMSLLVQYLMNQPQYKSRVAPTQVLDGTPEGLVKELKKLQATNYRGRINFIAPLPGQTPHFTAMMLNVENNQDIVAFIMDSTGNESGTRGLGNYVAWIAKGIADAKFPRAKVFSYEYRRQTDFLSCPVYVLRDIFESSKFDLFGFLNQVELKQPSLLNRLDPEKEIFGLMFIPPSMMKVSQSLTQLNKYQEAISLCEKPLVAHYQAINRSFFEEELLPTIARSTVNVKTKENKTKKINFYARKRAFKYMLIVIDTILKDLLN